MLVVIVVGQVVVAAAAAAAATASWLPSQQLPCERACEREK